MNGIKILKASIFLFVAITIIACNDDHNSEKSKNALLGEWLRSDVTDEFEYKLVFSSDNTGIRTQREGDENQGISSALTFEWTTNENVLKLDFNGEIETTNYTINNEGQLFLSDITEFHFTKIE